MLPQGAEATDVVINYNPNDLEVISGSYYLYPVQLPVYANGEKPPAFVEPDPVIYNSNTPFPQNKLYGYNTDRFRDYNYVKVNFCPFTYIPLNGELKLITEIEVIISYSTNTPDETFKLRPYGSNDEKAFEHIQSRVLNGNEITSFYPETTAKVNHYKNRGVSTVESKAFTPTELPALAGSDVHYVIITNDTDIYGNPILDTNGNPYSFTDKFQEFADWKTQNGTPTKVVTIDAIRTTYDGVDIPEKIREFIKDAVSLWNTEYVLLGGTASIVPVSFTPAIINEPIKATDLYYSAINGNNWNADGDAMFGESKYYQWINGGYVSFETDLCDFVPDIAVGRAPVDSDSDIETFIYKNIIYARQDADNMPTQTGWSNNQLNIGGIVKKATWPTGEAWKTMMALPTFEYLEITPFPNGSNQYTMLEFWENWDIVYEHWDNAYDVMDRGIYSGGADHDEILSKINEKPGIIFHIDHSGPHGMGLTETIHHTTGLNAQDWQSLEKSSHKYPIMFGYGCHTTPIEKSFFIGEQWLNAEGGGVAYLGTAATVSNRNSYSFSQKIFDNLYSDNLIIGDLLNMSSGPAEDRLALLGAPQYMADHATQRIFQLLGDPQLSIYTDVPNNLIVDHLPTPITTGNQDFSIQVSGVPNNQVATLSLYKKNEVLAVEQTVGGTLTFNITPDTTADELIITVTCPNANPYTSNIQVDSYNTNVHLYKSDIKIYDTPTGGNEINIIQPGQTVYLEVELTNTGINEATNISGALSIVNGASLGSSSFPNISLNASAFNDGQRYTFTAPTDIEYGGEVDFELVISLGGTPTFTESFFLNTKSAKLDIGDREVVVGGSIIETGTFNAGDEVTLTINLHNYSLIVAENVEAVLTLSPFCDVDATITDATHTFSTIGSFDTEPESFQLTVNQNCNTNDHLLLHLTLTDAFNNEKIFLINLSESSPELINAFDFVSEKEAITLEWQNAVWDEVEKEWVLFENVKGNNVYRYNANTDEWDKINDFLLTGATKFYDKNRTVQTNYQYKISVVSDTGNEKEISDLDTYHAWTSLIRHSSFPKTASTTVANTNVASPTVFDVNGDGNKEIFTNFRQNLSSRIMAFKQDGTELFDIDTDVDDPTGFAEVDGLIYAKSAIGDIDNNGYAEVLSASITKHPNDGFLFGFTTEDANNNNNPDPLWNGDFLDADFWVKKNPVLADINQDGKMEIMIIDNRDKIYVFDYNGNLLWQKLLENSGNGEIAVVDLDNNGNKEILVGVADYDDNGNGALYIWDYLGNPYSTNPLVTFLGKRADSGVVVADLDNDSEYEIILLTAVGKQGFINALNLNGNILWTYPSSGEGFNVDPNYLPRIAIGDIDQDGYVNIVFGGSSGIQWNTNSKLYILEENGTELIDPIPIKNAYDTAPLLADIDDDPDIEIIINADRQLYAFNPDGTECPYWRLSTGVITNPFKGSPFIGDIDNDSKNEVVAVSRDCDTYVWKTLGDADKVPWGSLRNNAQNTGVALSACEIAGTDVYIENGTTPTWSGNQFIGGNLVIKDNSILTIESGTISFSENNKLIIEKGSKVKLGGTSNLVTLKSHCGTYWNGIRVLGDATASQTQANQGTLIINGGVTIQNAEIAIYVGGEEAKMNKGEDLSGDETWNIEAGGIVQIDGGTNKTVEFINNISGIEIPQYRHNNDDNVSFIKNAKFTTTTDYNHLKNPDAFITLWNVGTIDIIENEFINDNEFEFDERGVCINQGRGIDSSIADVNISQNTFNNLFTGIKIGGPTALSDVIINENSFNNNISGVLLKVADNTTVTSNDFDVSNTFDFTSSYYKPSGIYIHETNGFHIENNSFSASGDTINETIGVYVSNCKAYNEIYRNNFNDLYIGIYSYGSNIDDNLRGSEGLNFICNSFQDILLSEVYLDQDSYLDNNQGSVDLAAGNTFSPTGTGTPDDIAINSRMIVNYYHRDVTPPSTYIPVNNNKSLINIPSNNLNTCTSKLNSLVSGVAISNKDNEINQIDTQLQSITDGGDTEALNETVDEAENNDAVQLRNELLSKSPSLSDTVMVNTTSIEYVLPALMVKQVLAANPKAAKSNKVQNALDDRQNPLPEYMRAKIDLGRNSLSYKEVLESKLAQIIHERENLINSRIIQLNREGSIESLDSLQTLLSNEANNKLNRAYQLVKYYLSKSENQNAENTFNDIPTNFDLTSSQQNKYDKLNQLYSIRFNLENADKSWFEMDSIQKGVVQTLAIDSTSTAGMQARSILALVDHIDYGCYIPDVVIIPKSGYGNEQLEETFKVYPEQANDYFIIEYVLSEKENPEEVSIAVFDDAGIKVKEFVIKTPANQFLTECASWQDGVYWCRKRIGKTVVAQQKVIIGKSSNQPDSVLGTNSLILFPNPTSAYFYVSFDIPSDTMTQSYHITVIDSKGALVGKFKLKGNLTKIATNKWQQGVYSVSILRNNKLLDSAKFLVE